MRSLSLMFAVCGFVAAFLAPGAKGQPVPLRKIEPEYTAEAKIAGLEGTAIVTAVIGEDGTPHDMQIAEPIGFGLDEKALEAITRWRFVPGAANPQGPGGNGPVAMPGNFAIDFRLPSKQSRWHLIEAKFQTPDGVLRPVFKLAPYPAGAGIGPDAIDEGQLVAASGRMARVSVSFDVDQRGIPVNFLVGKTSAEVWGPEAIRVLRSWRFQPATKDGKPVTVPCSVELAWGAMTLPPGSVPKPSQLQAATSIRPKRAVIVSLNLDENGAQRDLRVVESLGHDLDEAALDAISKMKFRPFIGDARSNGSGQSFPVMLRVEFEIRK